MYNGRIKLVQPTIPSFFFRVLHIKNPRLWCLFEMINVFAREGVLVSRITKRHILGLVTGRSIKKTVKHLPRRAVLLTTPLLKYMDVTYRFQMLLLVNRN